jgi:hypothetical protein
MLGLLAAAIVALPAQVMAQSTNSPAPKRNGRPFHGKLASVDKDAKSFKVGDTTYETTATTRITKAGQKATLDDGVVGEEVSGYAHETDGKMVASTVRFGPRADKKAPSNPPAAPSAPSTPPSDSK